MTTWQRKARTVIGLIALCLGVTVFLTLKERSSIETLDDLNGLNSDLIFHSTKSVVTQVTGEKRNLRIEAEQHFAYSDGSSRLEGVRVVVEGENGKDISITSRQGEVGQSEYQLKVSGEVILQASGGLSVVTEQASYDHRNGIVNIPGHLTFSRGALGGSAVGALYDSEGDQLRLFSESRVNLGRVAFNSDVAVLTNSTLAFSKNVQIDEGVRKTTAQAAYVQYDQSKANVKFVELREQVQMESRSTAPGSLKMMKAREIDLNYEEESGLLNQVNLLGDSEIVLAGSKRNAGEHIFAESIDVSLVAGEGLITLLEARGQVKLDLPNGDTESIRQVRAGLMTSVGEDTRGLTKLEFVENVEFRSLRSVADDQQDFVTTADRLETSVAGRLGAMNTARFTGHVVFSHGETEGTASLMFYDINAGVVRLRSYGGEGSTPHIMDSNIEIEAEEIDFSLDGAVIRAQGNVRSVLSFAGIFASSNPSYVKADQLAYDSSDRRTIFSGEARLWQGNTAIQSDTIELHQDTADVRAIGNVRSTFILEEIDDETKEVKEVSTIGVANAMHYEGVARRATYTEQAHVNGPQGDLSGEQVELYFGSSHRELDRIEASERVKLLLTGVTATGIHLTYFTSDGRYLMSGAPVQILEELPGECRETQGKLLTFYRSSETVSVDGNDEVRTITRTTSVDSVEDSDVDLSTSGNDDGVALVSQIRGNCPQSQFN